MVISVLKEKFYISMAFPRCIFIKHCFDKDYVTFTEYFYITIQYVLFRYKLIQSTNSSYPIYVLFYFFDVTAILKVQVIQTLESSICIDKDNRTDFETNYVQ